MSSPGSVTYWIGKLKQGDADAAQRLWEGYFQRLVGLARKKLQGIPRLKDDPEGVALSAFASFCRCAQLGRFPKLLDRDDLWQLLVMLTARKVNHLLRDENRQRPPGGQVLNEAALAGGDGDEAAALAQIIGREPSPEFAFQVADECRHLLDLLAKEDLRTIALLKMEGYTNEEIAAKLGWLPRTVERRLKVIRSIWSQEDAQ